MDPTRKITEIVRKEYNPEEEKKKEEIRRGIKMGFVWNLAAFIIMSSVTGYSIHKTEEKRLEEYWGKNLEKTYVGQIGYTIEDTKALKKFLDGHMFYGVDEKLEKIKKPFFSWDMYETNSHLKIAVADFQLNGGRFPKGYITGNPGKPTFDSMLEYHKKNPKKRANEPIKKLKKVYSKILKPVRFRPHNVI